LICTLLWQVWEIPILNKLQVLYFRISNKPIHHFQCKDPSGIPIQYQKDGSVVHNPLFIARCAQESFALGHLDEFIQICEWLVDNASVTDSTFAVYYSFDLDFYGQKAPWLSALSQAVIANLFIDRFTVDQDSTYLSYSQKALKTLQPGVSNLSIESGSEGLWYAEYPSDDPPYVLNGMIATLFELHEIYLKTGDYRALALFEMGHKAVVEKLSLYDNKGFSYYDLKGNKAGRLYHQKHIAQLAALNEIAPHEKLEKYHQRWSRHDLIPIPIQLIMNPKPRRILAFVLFWWILADLIAAYYLWKYLRRHR
jgi:hypothetical protein